jgi:hypothetical protein
LGKFDKLSNLQVQASLGTLHRAIDRALSLHDQLACRCCNAGCDLGDAGLADRTAQEPAAALEMRSILAPAPAAADLVLLPATPVALI